MSVSTGAARPGNTGYGLVELLAATSIVAILASIALPSYQSSRLKAARNLGAACLLDARQRIESRYARQGRYPPAGSGMAVLGYPDDPHRCDAPADYQLSLAITSTPGYTLTARAIGRQVADGDLLLVVDPRPANPNERLQKLHRRPDGRLLPDWRFEPGR